VLLLESAGIYNKIPVSYLQLINNRSRLLVAFLQVRHIHTRGTPQQRETERD